MYPITMSAENRYIHSMVHCGICKGEKEKYAFVFDSNFSTWNNKMKYHGAIIDNMRLSNFRAFEKADLIDVETTRRSLSSYFLGETRIMGWLRIERKTK